MRTEMGVDEASNEIRKALKTALSRRHVRPTPQCLASLLESVKRSKTEVLGMSDSILQGLLWSGSYTVDVLESAGVDPTRLRMLADDSVLLGDWIAEPIGSGQTYGDFSPDEWLIKKSPLLKHAMFLARKEGGVLETSHLLNVSVDPVDPSYESYLSNFTCPSFPLEQRTDHPPTTPLRRRLETRVCELMTSVAEELTNNARKMLRSRRHPITQEEDGVIDHCLGVLYPEMQVDELEFVISALNTWFTKQSILTDPPSLCLRTVARCSAVLYGTMLLAKSGGDINALDTGLDVAKNFSPERDLAGLAFLERKGRIYIGQYTYRNTFLLDTKAPKGYPVRRVAVQAIRPASLISAKVISDLEALLSCENLNEPKIQAFLVSHPEILQALGYATVRPHVCLYMENKDILIPDFILEIPGSRGFDILDLKLPSTKIIATSPYLHMSSHLVKAIAQLRKYAKFFDNAKNRSVFIQQYGLEPFKPELTVVIGRTEEFRSKDDRLEIEEQMGNIHLLTYDDLIAYGRSRSILVPR